jgi:hypothetical protein
VSPHHRRLGGAAEEELTKEGELDHWQITTAPL